MTAKKTPRVKVSYAECEMYASFAMVCPLCKLTISANTVHTCKRKQ